MSKFHWSAMLLALAGLSGCRELKGNAPPNLVNSIDIKPLSASGAQARPRIDIVTGRALPPIASPSGSSGLSSDVSISPPRTEADESLPEAGFTGPLAYYVAKCDIYWKLNWMRKVIAEGKVPPQLPKFIVRTRKENHAARQDGNATVAESALDHLEAGLQHWRVLQILEAANVRVAAVPWSSGAIGVQGYIDGGGFGFGGKPSAFSASQNASASPALTGDDDDIEAPSASPSSTPAVRLTAAQEAAIAAALRQASRYHASPDELMRTEWEKAITDINRLRDQLHLKDLPENKDSDTTHVDVELLRHAAQISGMESGYSAQDFDNNTPEGKALSRALREPVNPFQ